MRVSEMPTKAKRDAFDFLDRNARELAILSDSIFYFGELGLQAVVLLYCRPP